MCLTPIYLVRCLQFNRQFKGWLKRGSPWVSWTLSTSRWWTKISPSRLVLCVMCVWVYCKNGNCDTWLVFQRAEENTFKWLLQFNISIAAAAASSSSWLSTFPFNNCCHCLIHLRVGGVKMKRNASRVSQICSCSAYSTLSLPPDRNIQFTEPHHQHPQSFYGSLVLRHRRRPTSHPPGWT